MALDKTWDPAITALLGSCNVWDMTLPWLPEQYDMNTLKRFRMAGFTYVSASAQDFPPTFGGVKKCIQRLREAARAEEEWLTIGRSLGEIEHARREGKLVVGFNVQDTQPVGADLNRLEMLYVIGIRHMTLAYNIRNAVAGGCADPSDVGLTAFGRQVVGEMNRVGMLVDCSHTGRRSSLEAIELSEVPPIFSHTGAYVVCPHIRNIHDDQIRACAARHGVIGIVGIGAFLGDIAARAETMFRHIDYVATLVGPAHVGLGTDYIKDMASTWASVRAGQADLWPDPTGTQLYEGECVQPEQLAELVALMVRHGYATEAIKGILGENFRRAHAVAEARR